MDETTYEGRHKRYYEAHRLEILEKQRQDRQKNGTALDRAIAKGPAAVAALREVMRLKAQRHREKKASAAGRIYSPAASRAKLIVSIPPRPVPHETRQRYADLHWLIEQAGAVAVRRAKRGTAARRDFAVWTAAAASLPARPIPAEWQDWLAALGRGDHGGRALSTSNLADVYYRCGSLYRAGKLLGMEIRNPFAEIPEPRSTDFPAATSWRIMVEGFPRLLAATPDWRERAFFTVLRYTGLRVNEVLGLRREHVVLLGGQVQLQIVTQRPHRSAVASLTDATDATLKNKNQRRLLPITNPDLVAVLLRARRETPSLVATRSHDPNHPDPTRRGGTGRLRMIASPYLFPFSAFRVASLSERLHATTPDLPRGIGWHAFRHAFSAEARLVARVSIDELAQWLGHSSTLVTYGYLRGLLGEQPDLDSFSARVAAAQLRRPVEAPAPQNVLELPKKQR